MSKRISYPFVLVAIFIVLSLFSTTVFGGGVTIPVTNGEAGFIETLAGVRFRAFNVNNTQDIFLGVDIDNGGNRTVTAVNWNPAGNNNITLTYDNNSDKLLVTVQNTNGTFNSEYANFSQNLSDLGKTYTAADMNALQFTLVNRNDGAVVNLNNVMIDGNPIDGNNLTSTANGGWQHWHIAGYNFGQGFTLTGTLELGGTLSSGQETNKVEIKLGYIDFDDQAPSISIINTDIVSTTTPIADNYATFTFSGTDNVTTPENLSYACQLNDNEWQPCTSPHTYNALADGEYTFSVIAIDEAGNRSDPAATYSWTVDTEYWIMLPIILKN